MGLETSSVALWVYTVDVSRDWSQILNFTGVTRLQILYWGSPFILRLADT